MTGPAHGVVLQGIDSPAEFEAMVQEIEDLGFNHLWVTDSSLHSRNPYAYLALAAKASAKLVLGTAVTNPVTRHPGVTAVAAATVDAISHGRMILGIGAGDRPLLALGLRPAPPNAVRESIEAIRALLEGNTVTRAGTGFSLQDAHLRFETRPDIPIFVSASGPRMLRLAGEVADGVILLIGLFPEAIGYALSHIDHGAARANRPRPHVALFAYGGIHEDEERALSSGRLIAAWFPQTAPHVCHLAGLEKEVTEAVRRGYAGGEFQEAQSAASRIPDWFVRKVALSGNIRRTVAQLGEVLASGVDSVHVFPVGQDRMETVRAFATCWQQANAASPSN